MAERQTLSIVITDDDQRRLARLSVLMHGASKTDVVKRSLRMNEIILERLAAGAILKVVDADGREVELALV